MAFATQTSHLVIAWTYLFCIANKDFPFGFLGTCIHRSPSKGLLQLKAVHQPHSPTSSINVVFPLLHKESWIFHMAKKCPLIYFDPLWSSFPTNCQTKKTAGRKGPLWSSFEIWGRKRQFSSSGSWCYQHALGQHGWVILIDFVNDEIIGVDFAFWNLYKDPTWFLKFTDTVDGKNPAPAEVGSLNHYLQGLIHPRWLFGISEPSTVSSTTKPGFPMETPQKMDMAPSLKLTGIAPENRPL